MEKPTEQEPSEIEIKQAVEGQSVDWYLQTLVSLCNRSGLEIGITLTVGGSVITGTLIGGKKYFEIFAKQFSDAWPSEDKQEIRSAISQYATIYDATPDQQDESTSSPVQYIHLNNARVFHGQHTLPKKMGILWRGKINAVSGFFLGQLSIDN